MNRSVLSAIFALLTVATLLLAGCGGGGASGDSSVTFRVPVVWAERARALNGPASASSVTVTLIGAGPNGQDVAAFGERGDGPDARMTEAVSTVGARPGVWPMTVQFTTATGGGGDVVATANATVRLRPDGLLVNPNGSTLTVTNQSTIASVVVTPDQQVPVLRTMPVAVEVRDAQGNLIAVPEGAVGLSVIFGGAAEVVDGMLRGTFPGQVFVEATVDGVKSEAVIVTVVRPEVVRTSKPLPNSGLEFSPVTSSLYAAASGTENGVVTLNPETLAVQSNVPLETPPIDLAVSGDANLGFTLVASQTKVAIVNLRNGSLVSEFFLGDHGGNPAATGMRLAVSPTDSSLLVVLEATGSFRQNRLTLYKNGQRLPNSAAVDALRFDQVRFDEAGTAVYGVENSNGGDRHLVRVGVTSSGFGHITHGATVATAAEVFAVRGDRVYAGNRVYTASSLANVGAFNVGERVVSNVLITPSGSRAFVFAYQPTGAPRPETLLYLFDTTSFEKTEEFLFAAATPIITDMVATGERRFAYTTPFTPQTNPEVVAINLP